MEINFMLEGTEVSQGLRITRTSYTEIIEDYSGEWQIVLIATSRQDGRVAWSATLVEVDSETSTLSGLTEYDKVSEVVNKAINSLTQKWSHPINQE